MIHPTICVKIVSLWGNNYFWLYTHEPTFRRVSLKILRWQCNLPKSLFQQFFPMSTTNYPIYEFVLMQRVIQCTSKLTNQIRKRPMNIKRQARTYHPGVCTHHSKHQFTSADIVCWQTSDPKASCEVHVCATNAIAHFLWPESIKKRGLQTDNTWHTHLKWYKKIYKSSKKWNWRLSHQLFTGLKWILLNDIFYQTDPHQT